MLNDPPPEKKRSVHPLEDRAEGIRRAAREAQAQEQPAGEGGRQRVMLRIPVAKPNLTYALIAVNVAIFVVMFYILSPDQLNDIYEWGANNKFTVLEQGEFHRLLTAMFMHGSLTHLAFNMLSLYVIGQTVERFFGSIRFALIYFLGGLAGSVLSVLINAPEVNSVGASGAIFAIVGAELVFLYKHRKLFGAMAQQQLRSLIIIIALNLFAGFASNLTNVGVSIDNWGHIGGFIGGASLAWYISPFFLPRAHPDQPGALTIDDVNPLDGQFQNLMIYISGLLAIIIVGVLITR
ncbi:MAG: rhomboid family intramembrane serine protease [Aggregatilineales bacterium]